MDGKHAVQQRDGRPGRDGRLVFCLRFSHIPSNKMPRHVPECLHNWRGLR